MIHHKTHWDLIIVGAGALGTFHALFALRKGLNVLLLEKDLRPVEATVRNFGQVIPSGMVEHEWFDYGKVSLETYLSIQAEFDISVRQNGSTYLASTEEELAILHEKADFYDHTGYSPVRLTAAECIRKLPAVKSDYCKGGLYFPQEISIEPQIMIHRLHEYLIAKYDLDYRPSTPVKECIVNQNSCEVTDTMGNRYKAGRIMICNGRDFKFLLPELFLKSDQPIRCRMLSYQAVFCQDSQYADTGLLKVVRRI
jgi:FAD dependent oxidoreductase TIGR03364